MRDFPRLHAEERRTDVVAAHLRQATRAVTALDPHARENWASQAERLRAAAVHAEEASRVLRELCGWLEAASAAADDGLLDVLARDHGDPQEPHEHTENAPNQAITGAR